MTTRTNRLVLHVIPFVGSVVVAASTVLYGDRLGDRIAIHWSGSTADGFGSPTLLLLLNGVLVLALGYGLLALVRSAPQPSVARPLSGVAVGSSAFVAALHVVTLRANAAASSPEVVPFPGTGLVAALGVFVGVGLLGWAVGHRGTGEGPEQLPVEELAIEPGEAVVWTGGARAERWLLVIPALTAGFGVLLLAFGEWAAAAVVLASAALVLVMLRVRLTVGPAGVTAGMGPLGLLRTRVPLDEVAGVRAEQLAPMAYGGYGWRVLPGVRALVVRCGAAVHVERVDGPDLVVSVDDAPRAAGVLRAHLEARRG